MTARDFALARSYLECSVIAGGTDGGARVSFPIEVTEGRDGVTPALGLSYSGSRANSPYGVGWSLAGADSVTLDMQWRLPRYRVDEDRVALGGIEIVPLRDAAGVAQVEDRDGHRIERWRARTERLFERVERWVAHGTGRVHWRRYDRDGTISIYGQNADGSGRIADPGDPDRVTEWLLERRHHPKGDVTLYEYKPEDIAGVDPLCPEERNRRDPARQPMRYLKRIRYGATRPWAADAAMPPGLDWLFEVVVDYGEHGDAGGLPQRAESRDWEARPDAFSSYRRGYDLRVRRLARRILMVHHLAELAAPVCVAATELDFEQTSDGAILRRARRVGYRPAMGGRPAASRATPDLEFAYAGTSLDGGFLAAPESAAGGLIGAVARGGHTFVDLLGTGLPGLLMRDMDAWLFRENLGGGRFADAIALPEAPKIAQYAFDVGDGDGDGRVEAQSVMGRDAGGWRLDTQPGGAAEWRRFETMTAQPRVDFGNGRVQRADLNGDGHSDLLVDRGEVFDWYPADGPNAFEAARQIAKPADHTGGPVGTTDREGGYFWADMSGDGLSDLVRVTSGAVEVWPHMGEGRFGAPFLMDNAPQLPTDARRERLILADLTQNGHADLMLIGEGTITLWHNIAGNRFSAPVVLPGAPRFDGASDLQVMDILANGCPALVWSSRAPTQSEAALQYMPLGGAEAPGLLRAVRTGTGFEHRLLWGWSGEDFSAARQSDRPWATHLPRHRFVLRRLTGEDLVTGQRRSSLYSYADGAFDQEERRFVGFGYMETLDQEVGEETTAQAPPRLSRVWTHLGAAQPARLAGTWAGDAAAILPPPCVINDAATMPTRDFDDAHRALAGLILRREVFGCDVRGVPAPDPLIVTVSGYHVTRLHPGLGHTVRAAFAPLDAETLTWAYEAVPEDPKVSHVLRFDRTGTGADTLRAEIAYARRPGPERVPEQAIARGSIHRKSYTQRDTPRAYVPDILLETERFELNNLGDRHAPLGYEAARDLVTTALAAIGDFGTAPAPGPVSATRLGWQLLRYWQADGAGPAAQPADIGLPARVHSTLTALMTRGRFDAVYAPFGASAALLAEARLVSQAGYVWAPSAVSEYLGAAGFYRLSALHTPDGGRTQFAWRPDHLGPLASTLPDGSTGHVVLDPHTASVAQSTDPNGTVEYILHDPLGQPVRRALVGTQLGVDGAAHPVGGVALDALPDPHPGSDLAAALADPVAAVGSSGAVTFYDTATVPNRVLQLERETHHHDGEGDVNAAPRVRVQLSHVAGDGQLAQVKLRTGAGPALSRDGAGQILMAADGRPALAEVPERWLASGFALHAPNGLVLAEYEPFFSPSPGYEADDALLRNGASVMQTHDALGRVVRADYPDGTQSCETHSPWLNENWDRNDAVIGTAYEATRSALSADHPRRIALAQAQEHADTPNRQYMDAVGEVFRAMETGAGGTALETRATLTPTTGEGRTRDPRGLEQVVLRDMAGQVYTITAPDAGEALMLLRWDGAVLRKRDARGFVIRYGHDAMGRQTTTHTTAPGGGEVLVQRVVYGDDPGVADAAARNLLGRIAATEDGAGLHSVVRMSPFGAVLEESRRFLADARAEADWSAAPALEAEVFATRQQVDALGRVVRMTAADGTRLDYTYGDQGDVGRVAVTTADGSLADHAIASGFDFDARGLLLGYELGNGVNVARSYDPDTQRIARIRAEGPTGRMFQDMTYTFDPMGNLVLVEDAAQEPGAAGAALAGVPVSARRRYAHDPHYRLIRAEGRVHRALQINDYANGLGTGSATKNSQHITLDNGAEIERYTRHYSYDIGGNLTRIRHVGDTLNWTREIWVSPTSNRSLPAHDMAGTPLAAPETWFDAAGHAIRLPHLVAMDWSWQGTLARAVMIDRGGPGLDDAEYNHYAAGMARARRVTERIVGGGLEITDTRFLPGCTIRRAGRANAAPQLDRATVEIAAAGHVLARLHRWRADATARETDDIAARRLRYELSDHLGSATMELDENAGIVTYEEYFAYGGSSFVAGNDLRDVRIKENRFAGGLRDDATGLYCFGHRHYAPFVGNWLSPDPSGASDGLNLYRYARNNPVRYTDHSGLRSDGVDVRYIRFEHLPASLQTDENRQSGYSLVLDPETQSFVEVSSFAELVQQARERDLPLYIYDPRIQELADAHRDDPSEGSEQELMEAVEQALSEINAIPGEGDEGEVTIEGGGTGTVEEDGGGTGTADEGTGPGAGQTGTGIGGGGDAEDPDAPPADGTDPGNGTGTGQGDATGPGRGTGTTPGGTPGATGTTPGATGTTPGADGKVPGATGNGTNPDARGKTPGGSGPPGSDGNGNTPGADGNGGADPGGSPPPEDAPVGENGVPYTPGMSYTPVDQIPQDAEFTTDPSQVGQGGDARGAGGAGENPDARPTGQGGTGGATEGQGSGQAGQGGGAGGQGAGGDPRNTDGRRGIKGGQGSLELPSWLSWVDPALDGLQLALDVVGLIPGLGEIADGINGVISLIRGDYVAAGLSFAAMIPFLGWGATAGKFGRRAVNAADLVGDVSGVLARNGDSLVRASRSAFALRNPFRRAPGQMLTAGPGSQALPALAQSLRGFTRHGDDVANAIMQGHVVIHYLDDLGMNTVARQFNFSWFERMTLDAFQSGQHIFVPMGRDARTLIVHETDHLLRKMRGTSTYTGARRFGLKLGDAAEEWAVRANERAFARAAGLPHQGPIADAIDVLFYLF